MIFCVSYFFFFFQAEDGIRDRDVTGVQTCALPILLYGRPEGRRHPTCFTAGLKAGTTEMPMTRVGLVAKTGLQAAAGALLELAGWLEARGVHAMFETHTASIAGLPSDRATVDRTRMPH